MEQHFEWCTELEWDLKRLRSEPCLYMQSLIKRREITYILAVYVDDMTYKRNWRRNHKNKKISEREILDHRCRWSLILLLE